MKRLAVLAFAAALAICPSGHAAVVATGNFNTGTPTPTLSVTAPFSLSITASGQVFALVFDEWSTGSRSTFINASPAGQNWSYQINNGPTLTIGVDSLLDRSGNENVDLSPNDGYLTFASAIPVTAGQTITFFTSAVTFAPNSFFGQPPASFTGNVFLIDIQRTRLSANGAVPEPSTWALALGGAGLLGLVARRRRGAKG